MKKELIENEEQKEVAIARLLQLIEVNSITLQDYYNIDSPKSITKQYKELIKRYSHELAELVSFKMKGNKLSQMECVELFIAEKTKIKEVEKQLKIQEEKRRKDSELGRDNIILMLDVHRKFAKYCLFGDKPINPCGCKVLGVEWIEEFDVTNLLTIEDRRLIDFMTLSRLMATDNVIHSYCEDIRISDFANNLIERNEYYLTSVKNLEWDDISIIDIEILFDSLRENQFIASDTTRDTFFEIFNPHLSVFDKPIQWQDIKELAYFLDKCIEYGFIKNNKYQSLIEKYRMFTTKRPKGNYIKSSSLSSTLSDVKNGSLNTATFEQRIKLMDEFLEDVTI